MRKTIKTIAAVLYCKAHGFLFEPRVFTFLVASMLWAGHVSAQTDQSNLQFTEGRINDSGSLSLAVPLGSYKGRGMDLPISLSYSSDIWKIEHLGKVSNTQAGCCVTQSVTEAIYGKNTVSGWKSALDLPIIEYPKSTTAYDYNGKSHDPAGGCFGYRVREVYIHMPDGSTQTLRKNDQPSNNPSGVDMSGTFYAIDGSRMRFDADGTPDTGTIYMPDGTRYILGHPTSSIVDRNGNTLSYNEGTRQWTDTLGRVIANPLPATPTVGDFPYNLPGLAGVNGGVIQYTFKWRNLADVLTPDDLGNTPALRMIGSEALPYPNNAPGSGNFPVANSTQYDILFKSTPFAYGENGPLVPTLIVGHAQSSGQLFNPVVLSEIVLPDGTRYRFTYNIYGEIDKVVYPTNSYDKYSYYGPAAATAPPENTEEENPQPYIQALRSLTSRKQSVDGSGSDIRLWAYAFYKDLDGNSSSSITNPDGTRTATVNYGPGPKTAATTGSGGQSIVMIYPFGFRDARVGMPAVKKFYGVPVGGNPGELLRQEVFQYEQSTVNYTVQCQLGQSQVTRTYPLSRTPRLTRKTDFVFEGTGPALAQSSTFQYDLANEFSTGIDQTLAVTYHYVVVANQTAKDTDTPEELTNISLGTLAKYTETQYNNDPVYRNANILGLALVVAIKDSSGNIVSRSEMVYDECPQYCATAGRALPTSMKTWDSTKGSDPASAATQLVTHAKFDQWGNRTEATDAKGFVTTTAYDTNYQTFPVQVISPVPDPTGTHGSSTSFTTTTTYDTPAPNQPPLGLVVATTDANGQTTTISYVDPLTGLGDPLLRPRKVTAPNGHQTITEYGAGTSEATRWVKVRTQIDNEKWSEAISKYDGLGRTYLTEKIDSQGSIFTETEYDLMDRVKRSTNPYKSGETKQWTTPEYDDLSRTKKVISPDTDDVQITYALSTVDVIGTRKTITDQAGRERTGITDALGNMVRVYEGPLATNQFTDYVFDTLGNLRKTIQGEQSRYFMYDSLGRVLFAKQPEQDTNVAFIATDPITNNSAWSVRYSYDDNGNILTTTDARNISIARSYDNLNRLTFRNYSDATPDVDFFYDGTGLGTSPPNFSKGKTTRVASSVSESRNTSFDQMGRLLTSEQRTTAEQLAGTQAPYSFSYAYNLSGALIEETYPSGRVVKNTLNADGELLQVQSRKNGNFGYHTYADSFTYNSAGAVTKMQLGNGRWETASYNERLQVTQIGLGVTSVDQNLLKLEFKYNTPNQADNNGSMREQKITVPTVGANPGFTATQSYVYDSLNRIKSATENLTPIGGTSTQTWKQTFDYDRYGNRRFDAANTTTLGSCNASVCNPEINTSDNRLKKDQAGGTAVDYDYDATGALTKDFNGQRFGYDAESHQKEFFSASNQTTTPDATYHYDGEGRRVKKVVGSEVTIFVYDASGQLAAEYSTTIASVQNAKVSYLTTDHLGSPRIITDQNGVVISRKDFTAFGEEVTSSQRVGGSNGNGYDPPNVRQDYTGYQKDNESGLEFAQARYYNTGHGRFTSVDPLTASATIRNPQTFNRYSYVSNSPYEFVDTLGLFRLPSPQVGDSGVCKAEYSSCSDEAPNPFAAERELQTRKNSPGRSGQTTKGKGRGQTTRAKQTKTPPKPKVKIIPIRRPDDTTSRVVTGVTAKDAITDAQKNGEAATTIWDYAVQNINFTYTSKKVQAGYELSLTVTDFEFTVATEVTMPTWSTNSPAEQSQWNTYYTGLRDHEAGHVEIAEQGATGVASAVATALSQPMKIIVGGLDRTTVDAAANAKFTQVRMADKGIQAAVSAVQTRSLNYDSVTKKGAIPRSSVTY